MELPRTQYRKTLNKSVRSHVSRRYLQPENLTMNQRMDFKRDTYQILQKDRDINLIYTGSLPRCLLGST